MEPDRLNAWALEKLFLPDFSPISPQYLNLVSLW